MSPQQILLTVGAAAIVLGLSWGAFAHIEKLNSEIGRLEARYEQIEQNMAALARERAASERVLIRHDQALREIRDELSLDLSAFGKSLRDDEETRAWAAGNLPADLVGLFDKSKPGPVRASADPTGQPAANSAGAATGGSN